MTSDITDALQKFIESRLMDLHTCLPGKIETYNSTTRKATVKPLVKKKLMDGTDLEIQAIESVPVILPSVAGFTLEYPIKKGDGCLILFAETGIGNYLLGAGQVKEADDKSRFSLTDAICIPGLYPFSQVPKNSTSTIKITEAGTVEINGNTKSFVTHTELNAALQTFITALNLHVHTETGATTLPPTVSMSLDISSAQTTTVKTGG